MAGPRRINLTHEAIKALPFAKKRQQLFYWDEALPGFGLRVTRTSKSLFVQYRTVGHTCRELICRYETMLSWVAAPMSLDEARQRAWKRLSAIKRSKERNEESGYADKWESQFKPKTDTDEAHEQSHKTNARRLSGDKREVLIQQLVSLANRMKLDELERLVTQASKRV